MRRGGGRSFSIPSKTRTGRRHAAVRRAYISAQVNTMTVPTLGGPAAFNIGYAVARAPG